MAKCFFIFIMSAIGAITHPVLWYVLLLLSAPNALNWTALHGWILNNILSRCTEDFIITWGLFWIGYTFFYDLIMSRSGILPLVVGGLFATIFCGPAGGCFFTIGYFVASLFLVLPLQIIATFRCGIWLIRGLVANAARR